MSLQLTPLQKRLCNILQEGLPICSRPFAEIAKVFGSSERNILRQVGELKNKGVIRRIGAVINYRAIGRISTLVTAHVPQEDVREVAEAVNKLAGVSHNYLREHHYNLWFTLQGQSRTEIEVTLSELSARFEIDFHSLPVERVFKLDVRFDAENGEGASVNAEGVVKVPKTKKVPLNDKQKQVLAKLQNELDIVATPFDFLCDEKSKEKDVFKIINSLIDKRVISRIAAIVDHRKLGFIANVLFVCSVPQERIVEAGNALAGYGMISHCYQRRTFTGWPYNLFAMMHGLSMGDIQRTIDEFTESEKIEDFEMLPTTMELKKQAVRYLK